MKFSKKLFIVVLMFFINLSSVILSQVNAENDERINDFFNRYIVLSDNYIENTDEFLRLLVEMLGEFNRRDIDEEDTNTLYLAVVNSFYYVVRALQEKSSSEFEFFDESKKPRQEEFNTCEEIVDYTKNLIEHGTYKCNGISVKELFDAYKSTSLFDEEEFNSVLDGTFWNTQDPKDPVFLF